MEVEKGSIPQILEGLKASELVDLIWGDQLIITPSELMLHQAKSREELLNRYLRVKWFNLDQYDLCSIRVSGPRGDDEVYQIKSIQKLLPRTFIVPWLREEERLDVDQSITGLTKIAGMQDEGIDQVIDIEAVNISCLGGEVISVEKANGKACVCWVKRLAGEWTLGFGSKTAIDQEHLYVISAPLHGELSWLDWIEQQLKECSHASKQEGIITQVAWHTLSRLAKMSPVKIAQFIDDLMGGLTLCGELEEGGRHVVPNKNRVVYFVGSTLTREGIKLDSPLSTIERLAELGFQTYGELAMERVPFSPLRASPSSLELSPGLKEGRVRYFMSARGEVIATMKIKDPHYMFYRKLRNAMCSSADSAPAVLKRLEKSIRDSYYRACLRRAGLPADFNQEMMRSAGSFLAWFIADPQLGEQFQLAGFQGGQIGLGALLERWRADLGVEQLGEYSHLIAHPQCYHVPEGWLDLSAHGEIAMIALHGAQGSGKTTLSRVLSQRYTQRSLKEARLSTSQTHLAHLCVAVEQDPLQKKRFFTEWLEEHLFPLLTLWLTEQDYPLNEDALPPTITSILTWERLGEGRAGAKFIVLLDLLCLVYDELIKLIESRRREDLPRLTPRPIILINARCNQNYQATQSWRAWLDQKAKGGLSTIRLNAPLELLRERINKRGRHDDHELIGDPVERTLAQVNIQRYIDLELDANLPIEALVEKSLALVDLALERTL